MEPTTTTEQNTDTNTEQNTDTGLSQNEATNTEQNKATPQELKQRQIVASKQALIDEGKLDHSDLAPWLQERTTPKENPVKEQETSEQRIYAKVREDMEYEALKSQVPSDLTPEQKQKIEAIENDPDYSAMNKSKRLKFALVEAGVKGTASQEELMRKGIQIGQSAFIGNGDYQAEDKQESEQDKITAKRMSTLPKWAQK